MAQKKKEKTRRRRAKNIVYVSLLEQYSIVNLGQSEQVIKFLIDNCFEKQRLFSVRKIGSTAPFRLTIYTRTVFFAQLKK